MPLPPAPTRKAARLSAEALQAPAPAAPPKASTTTATASNGRRKAIAAKSAPMPSAPTPPAPTAPAVTVSPPVAATAPTLPIPSRRAARRTAKRNGTQPSRLFVLDTNVLMHDPVSLFRFEEHDIFLPMIVLEELDSNKKGMSEVARNARQASRTLDALAAHRDGDINAGLPLAALGNSDATGQLFSRPSR